MAERTLGALTFEEAGRIGPGAVFCLPMGSMEQHGPHLPLDTDTVLAKAMTARIVARWGETYDLWTLPALPLGLSLEHGWAPGTLSLSVAGLGAALHEQCRALAGSLPARRLLIVNGHGGNRGLLEVLGRELREASGFEVVALHLGPLMALDPAGGPDIHAGRDETSAMLAVAPEYVRIDRIRSAVEPASARVVGETVLDPGASWPWRSDDPQIACGGVMGDPRGASAERGEAIVARVVAAAGAVLARLCGTPPVLTKP